MSTQATPEEIATVVADAQTWPDAYVARRVILHLAGEVAALRRQVEELREIELSEECRGLLMANGSDGTILVCGEFTNGREFSQKFRARATSPDVVTVPREEERRTWRDFSAGWAAARRSTPRQSSDEECAVRDGLASAWIEALNGIDALRSGETQERKP